MTNDDHRGGGGDGAPAPVLPYLAPPKPDARTPSPITATLLCLPGVACWCLLGIVVVAIEREREPAWLPGGPWLLVLWSAAVVTAVASVRQYVRLECKPWYVLLCLIVNGLGLAFTGLVVLLLVVSAVA